MELSGWLSKLPTSCFLLVFFQLTRARELEAPSSRFSEVFDSCFSSDSCFFSFSSLRGNSFSSVFVVSLLFFVEPNVELAEVGSGSLEVLLPFLFI